MFGALFTTHWKQFGLMLGPGRCLKQLATHASVSSVDAPDVTPQPRGERYREMAIWHRERVEREKEEIESGEGERRDRESECRGRKERERGEGERR